MSLEFSDTDILSGDFGAEKAPESSEKYKEQARKTQIQLQKIKKDEQWAKQDNARLFDILSKFIQDPYYASLIPAVTRLLTITTPSRAIIVMIGLFYPDAAYHIAQSTGNRDAIKSLLALYKYTTPTEFQENAIDPSIREWVTVWIGLAESFLTQEDGNSLIMVQKIHDYMENTHQQELEEIMGEFFLFFFGTRNLIMSKETARAYAQFIQKNFITALTKRLQLYHKNTTTEDNILHKDFFNENSLFGLK